MSGRGSKQEDEMNIPTLKTLIDRLTADIESRLSGVSILPFSVLGILTFVYAKALHYLYLFLRWLSRQLFPDTCEEEFLVRHGALWGVTRKSAYNAGGPITISGEAENGLPVGTVWSAKDGAQYASVEEKNLSGQVTIQVVALQTGKAGNRAAGETFTLVQPIPGVQSSALAGQMSGGADIEDIESWRARIIDRIQQPPMNGAKHDYERWALEVPGVTRAWCYPLGMGAGTVVVRFVRDNDGPGIEVIPDVAEVQAVYDHIEPLRPVTAKMIHVVAPVPRILNFEISITNDTPSNRQAIERELTDLVWRTAEPGAPGYIDDIKGVIKDVVGAGQYRLIAPAADVEIGLGEMLVMGEVAWK